MTIRTALLAAAAVFTVTKGTEAPPSSESRPPFLPHPLLPPFGNLSQLAGSQSITADTILTSEPPHTYVTGVSPQSTEPSSSLLSASPNGTEATQHQPHMPVPIGTVTGVLQPWPHTPIPIGTITESSHPRPQIPIPISSTVLSVQTEAPLGSIPTSMWRPGPSISPAPKEPVPISVYSASSPAPVPNSCCVPKLCTDNAIVRGTSTRITYLCPETKTVFATETVFVTVPASPDLSKPANGPTTGSGEEEKTTTTTISGTSTVLITMTVHRPPFSSTVIPTSALVASTPLNSTVDGTVISSQPTSSVLYSSIEMHTEVEASTTTSMELPSSYSMLPTISNSASTTIMAGYSSALNESGYAVPSTSNNSMPRNKTTIFVSATPVGPEPITISDSAHSVVTVNDTTISTFELSLSGAIETLDTVTSVATTGPLPSATGSDHATTLNNSTSSMTNFSSTTNNVTGTLTTKTPNDLPVAASTVSSTFIEELVPEPTTSSDELSASLSSVGTTSPSTSPFKPTHLIPDTVTNSEEATSRPGTTEPLASTVPSPSIVIVSGIPLTGPATVLLSTGSLLYSSETFSKQDNMLKRSVHAVYSTVTVYRNATAETATTAATERSAASYKSNATFHKPSATSSATSGGSTPGLAPHSGAATVGLSVVVVTLVGLAVFLLL